MEVAIFFADGDALWVQVIKEIHGDNAYLDSYSVPSRCSGPWCNIIRTISNLRSMDMDLTEYVSVKMGKGD